MPFHRILFVLFAGAFSQAAEGDQSRDLSPEEVRDGFVSLFDGKTLKGWVGLKGNTDSYYVKDGMLICKDTGKVHIFTTKEYANFILRLEIKMDPGGNNGVGIRTKVSKQPHIEGTEVQVLDDPFYDRGIPRCAAVC